jgi:hypothetical protein
MSTFKWAFCLFYFLWFQALFIAILLIWLLYKSDSAPSMYISLPVIWFDWVEARNNTRSATCSAFPGLCFNGCFI